MIYFVTGTDTDCGKTLVSSALLYRAKHQLDNVDVFGLKPIASGCKVTNAGLRNSDALSLIQNSNLSLEYKQVNPFSFEPAIAPHIAAKQIGCKLTISGISQALSPVTDRVDSADLCLIEGAGGWRLPLGDGQFLSSYVKQHDYGVILVVGVKLGCLNHAILTQEAIVADGLTIVGWVANIVDSATAHIDENISTLETELNAPCLGVIPNLSQPTAKMASKYLTISPLI